MTTTIKITQLPDIGVDITNDALLPIVNMTTAPQTARVSVSELNDFMLSNATDIVASGNLSVTGTASLGNIIGTGNLLLQPDPANTGAYLDVYLTTGPDIHIAGNGENVIIGRDTGANVTIGANGNVVIRGDNGTPHDWTFGADGDFSAPGNISLNGGVIRGGILTPIDINDPITSIILGVTTTVALTNSVFTFPVRGTVVISGVTSTIEANGTWFFEASDFTALDLYTDDTYSLPVDSTTWTPFVTGAGTVAITTNVPDTDVVIDAGGYHTTFTNLGNLVLPTSPFTSESFIQTPADSTLILNVGSGAIGYEFGADGNLTIPGIINSTNGIQINSSLGINLLANSATGIEIDSGNVNVYTNNFNTWTFDANGDLNSATSANVTTSGNVSASFFTGDGSQLTNLPGALPATHYVFGADYTASLSDEVIFVYNNAVSTCTVSLPATAPDGKIYTIKKTGSFGSWTVVVDTVGGSTTIDDQTSVAWTAAYGYITVCYSTDQPGYWIISEKIA